MGMGMKENQSKQRRKQSSPSPSPSLPMGDGDGGISELGDSTLDLPNDPEGKFVSIISPVDFQILLGSESLSLPLAPAGIRSWFSSGECDALFEDPVLQEDVEGGKEDYIGNHFRHPNEQYKRGDVFLLSGNDSKDIDKRMVFSNVAAADDGKAEENNGGADNLLHDDEIEATQLEAAEMPFCLENVLSRAKCEDLQNTRQFSLIHPKSIVERGTRSTEEVYTFLATNDEKARQKEGCNLKNVLSSSKHEIDQKMITGSVTGAFISPKSRENHFTMEITNLVTERKKCAVSVAGNNRSEENKSCNSTSVQEGYPALGKEHMAASRRPFSEISNIVQLQNLDQKVGKWQCPRKRKTDLGPPMKQLRLEQWIRRAETKSSQHIR